MADLSDYREALRARQQRMAWVACCREEGERTRLARLLAQKKRMRLKDEAVLVRELTAFLQANFRIDYAATCRDPYFQKDGDELSTEYLVRHVHIGIKGYAPHDLYLGIHASDRLTRLYCEVQELGRTTFSERAPVDPATDELLSKCAMELLLTAADHLPRDRA